MGQHYIMLKRGRPLKYTTNEQRLVARKYTFKKANSKRIAGRYWRLVIPDLQQYGTDWTYDTPAICELRAKTVDQLALMQCDRGLDKWLVAVERHPGSGRLHLDILLVYDKRIKNILTRYDYLGKHGNLTRYRTVNTAILDYGRKQDPAPLGNLDTVSVIMQSRVTTDLYAMMRQAMLRDPFKFNPIDWLAVNNLDTAAVRTNVYKTIRLIKDLQSRECNRHLVSRLGFRVITPELIQSHLSTDQLELFRSWRVNCVNYTRHKPSS